MLAGDVGVAIAASSTKERGFVLAEAAAEGPIRLWFIQWRQDVPTGLNQCRSQRGAAYSKAVSDAATAGEDESGDLELAS